MKKTLLAVITVVTIITMLMSPIAANAQGYRGGYGHHGGGGGAGLLIAAIATLFVGTAIARAIAPQQVVVVDQQPQQPVYQNQEVYETPAETTVETWVGPPNRQGPAQFREQKCFNNEVYFPNGALIFDSYGRQIGHINPGKRYAPGKCFN